LGRSMTYKITGKIIEKNLSTEAIRQAINYMWGTRQHADCPHDRVPPWQDRAGQND